MQQKISVFLIILSTLFAGGLAHAQTAAEQQSQAEPQVIGVAQAVDLLVGEGRYDDARRIIRLSSPSAVDHNYVEAKIAFHQGRVADAIAILRQIVQVLPDAVIFRQALAETLVADRRFESARFQYEELRRINPNPQARDFYAKQIAAINAKDGFGTAFSLNITPDWNINDAHPDGNVYDFFFRRYRDAPEELSPQFGLRFSPEFTVYHRLALGDQKEIISRFKLGANIYTVETLDTYFAAAELNYRQESARGSLDIGLFARRDWGDGWVYNTSIGTNIVAIKSEVDENSFSFGANLQLVRVLNPRTSLQFGLNYSREVFDDQDRNGYLDADEYGASASLTWRATPRNQLTVGLSINRYDEFGNPNVDGGWHRDYWGYGVNANVQTIWKNGFVSSFGLSYTERQYDGIGPFPTKPENGKFERRFDDVYGVNFSLQNNNWEFRGFTPRLSCSYSVTDSNIYNYERYGGSCGVQLSAEF